MDLIKKGDVIENASIINRFSCFLIDTIILSCVVWLYIYIFNPNLMGIILLILILNLYFPFSESWFQTTIGKKLGKLYVVSATKKEISHLNWILRFVFFEISCFFFNLGNLLAIIHPKNKTLHDIVSKTRVIYVGEKSKSSFKQILILIFSLFGFLFLLGFFLRIVILKR